MSTAASIKITSRRGVVAFAKVKVGNRVMFESREWGDAYCTVRECRMWAEATGYAITKVA